MWPELAPVRPGAAGLHRSEPVDSAPGGDRCVPSVEVAVGGKVRKTPQEVVSKLGSEHWKFQPGKLCEEGGPSLGAGL